MPYARPSLSELRKQVAQDLASAQPGSDPLLRFSPLRIMGEVQAGMSHGHYGFLDYIAQQSVPTTATGEYLEAWAAMKRVYRKTAQSAAGTVLLTGTAGSTVSVPSGTPLQRGDGNAFVTTAAATITGATTATVAAQAVADATGKTGAWGNCDAGTVFTVGTAIAGLQSSATAASDFTGGDDLESDDALRARMLLAYQNPPHGGAAADYVEWALEVAGVTRAWCVPNAFGTGTVAIYVMFDVAEATHGGFPQGTDGISASDLGPLGTPRDTVATGDQLAVANAVFVQQPVTALVYVMAPTAFTQSFTIAGGSTWPDETTAAVSAAISNVFLQYAEITAGGSTLDLSYVESAIAAVPGTQGFVITSPVNNIVTGVGQLPVLGAVFYTD